MSVSHIRVPGGYRSTVSFGGVASPIGPVFASCIAMWKWQAEFLRPIAAKHAASLEYSE